MTTTTTLSGVAMTDKDKLTAAFKTLRARGYFARQNFWCCQSCACYDIGDKGKSERYAFYHKQDAHALDSYGNVRKNAALFIAWAGDGFEIAGVLVAAGLRVEWNGDSSTRIAVKGVSA